MGDYRQLRVNNVSSDRSRIRNVYFFKNDIPEICSFRRSIDSRNPGSDTKTFSDIRVGSGASVHRRVRRLSLIIFDYL